MTPNARDAAAIIWQHWTSGTRIAELPEACRPRDRVEGYAVQAEVARLSGQAVVGWKIAATSLAGQRHIGVDGPLAGRLLSGRMIPAPDTPRIDTRHPATEPCVRPTVSLTGNIMRVAEAEFAFRLGAPLPPRPEPYGLAEVLDTVESLHLAFEIPDSRFENFARVGAPQLIADTACAWWCLIGPPVQQGWRERNLAAHTVEAYKNGEVAGVGRGANVLGDPGIALTWIANELRVYADGLQAGDVVITGTCVAPIAIAPGDRVDMDFGDLGAVGVAFSE